ncbi:MAG: ABC transporter ATP-binding protein [Chloroflexi bacterium]|nr:ABC transporter ATP-binding protein [Chloroflexota bacterium]
MIISPLLHVDHISLSFGGIRAVQNLDFQVRPGEIFAIIGPNGAGKTSTINSISGFYRPQQGRIYFKGQDISDLPTYKRAPLGIARTFQNIALYTNMTALDNLMAARYIYMKSGLFSGAIYWDILKYLPQSLEERIRKVWQPAIWEEVENRHVVEEIIDFLEMAHVRKMPVGTLAYGLRKRVELGRALALEPELLLLDEPMAGMNVEEKEDMARFILDIHEQRNTTIVLIEHDVGLVMDIADRIVVLDFGQKIGEGTPEEISKDERVIEAYLGEQGA